MAEENIGLLQSKALAFVAEEIDRRLGIVPNISAVADNALSKSETAELNSTVARNTATIADQKSNTANETASVAIDTANTSLSTSLQAVSTAQDVERRANDGEFDGDTMEAERLAEEAAQSAREAEEAARATYKAVEMISNAVPIDVGIHQDHVFIARGDEVVPIPVSDVYGTQVFVEDDTKTSISFTSDPQTQLDNKARKNGDTFTGVMAFSNASKLIKPTDPNKGKQKVVLTGYPKFTSYVAYEYFDLIMPLGLLGFIGTFYITCTSGYESNPGTPITRKKFDIYILPDGRLISQKTEYTDINTTNSILHMSDVFVDGTNAKIRFSKLNAASNFADLTIILEQYSPSLINTSNITFSAIQIGTSYPGTPVRGVATSWNVGEILTEQGARVYSPNNPEIKTLWSGNMTIQTYEAKFFTTTGGTSPLAIPEGAFIGAKFIGITTVQTNTMWLAINTPYTYGSPDNSSIRGYMEFTNYRITLAPTTPIPQSFKIISYNLIVEGNVVKAIARGEEPLTLLRIDAIY